MINFRFHLVSLIAVFLALALGIVMGATVIDQAIVDTLNARIDDVRDEANDQRAENGELRDELNRFRDYLERSDDYAAAGRLTGVPVPVLAVRGVDDDDVRRTLELVQQAGALAPGIVWLEEKWLVGDEESLQQLADIAGEPVESGAVTVRDAALLALGERLAAGSASLGTDLLTTLAETGFISFEAVGDQAGEDFDLATYPGPDGRVVLVSGTDSIDDDNELLAPATRGFVASELAAVVGETFREEEDGPDRGSWLAPVHDDEELAVAVSTVDDLDLIEGPLTVVLALSDLGRGVIGQYGYGDGADQSLPEPEAAPQ